MSANEDSSNEKTTQACGDRTNTVDKQIDSRLFFVQNKRCYVDLMENNRGQFVKISEISTRGLRHRIYIPVKAVPDFIAHLNNLIEHFDTIKKLPKGEKAKADDRGRLKFAVMEVESRKLLLELKENSFGYFLRISSRISGFYDQFALPANGMTLLSGALTALMEKFSEVHPDQDSDPDHKAVIHVDGSEDNCFEIAEGRDKDEKCILITQVQRNVRTAISIRESMLSTIMDALAEFVKKEAEAEVEGGMKKDSAE